MVGMKVEGKVWLDNDECQDAFGEVGQGPGACVRLELAWRGHGFLLELDPASAAWLAAALSAQVAESLRGE